MHPVAVRAAAVWSAARIPHSSAVMRKAELLSQRLGARAASYSCASTCRVRLRNACRSEALTTHALGSAIYPALLASTHKPNSPW